MDPNQVPPGVTLADKPLVTMQESRQRAEAWAKTVPHFHQATVYYLLSNRSIYIEVDSRNAHALRQATDHLVRTAWPRYFPKQIHSTSLHAEILDMKRREGFLLRLVRRGFPSQDAKVHHELASFTMLVPCKPPMRHHLDACEFEDLFAEEEDGEQITEPPFDCPLTPGVFLSLLPTASQCSVVLKAWPIELDGVFYQGRVYRPVSKITAA